MLQDGALIFSTGNGNAVSISDLDVGSGTVQVTLTASHGLITLGGTTGLTFITGDGAADSTLVFEGTITDINNALANLSFMPTIGYHGPASLQITTNDLGLTGSGGNQTDTISISVAQPIPTVYQRVSASSPDDTYKAGDTVSITITTLDQAVTVDTTGGTPTLLRETGTTDRNTTYASGSGSNTLIFSYIVQAGDASADLNYASTSALTLNSAIRNTSSLAADLTLPTVGDTQSIAGQKDLVIDGIAPVISSVTVPANGVYLSGQNLDFTVNLSEAITVDTAGGTPRIAIALDTGGTAYASYVSGSGTGALVFRLHHRKRTGRHRWHPPRQQPGLQWWHVERRHGQQRRTGAAQHWKHHWRARGCCGTRAEHGSGQRQSTGAELHRGNHPGCHPSGR